MTHNEMVGPFLGFTFNGIHSSSLNIVRTSDSNRYNMDLSPAFTDKTTQVKGSDETYYFGMDYTQQPINISFAFDNISKANLQEIKQWINQKKPARLYLDEDCTIRKNETTHQKYADTSNAKYLICKISGTPNLKYLCFTEGEDTTAVDVYKGEGIISFVAFYPFWKKDMADIIIVSPPSSSSSSSLAVTTTSNTSYTKQITSASDIEMDWILYVKFGDNHQLPSTQYDINGNNGTTLQLDAIAAKTYKIGNDIYYDTHIGINSKTNLIEGYKYNDTTQIYTTTGNIYNESILSGIFFKLPAIAESQFTIVAATKLTSAVLSHKELYY